MTAAVYQEWEVVKVNKFGRRQARTMGVDSTKIYNKKRRREKEEDVYRAHRDIATVEAVDIVSEQRGGGGLPTISEEGGERRGKPSFLIRYKDRDVVQYITESESDCVEIVAKIRYIINHLI